MLTVAGEVPQRWAFGPVETEQIVLWFDPEEQGWTAHADADLPNLQPPGHGCSGASASSTLAPSTTTGLTGDTRRWTAP
jgi:hypothetical protein